MAKEKNLTTVTSIAAADFARLVTSAGASVKATAANLAKYIIETYNGSTVAGSAQSVKSALDSLNSKISSNSGGVPIRKAGFVAAGSSFTVDISNAMSANEGFALVSLNLSGNSIIGCELLYLGKGTSKIKPLIGSMDTGNYSASYSNGTWTITATMASGTMYYTAIVSK